MRRTRGRVCLQEDDTHRQRRSNGSADEDSDFVDEDLVHATDQLWLGSQPVAQFNRHRKHPLPVSSILGKGAFRMGTGRVSMTVLPPINPEGFADAEAIAATARQRIAEALTDPNTSTQGG